MAATWLLPALPNAAVVDVRLEWAQGAFQGTNSTSNPASVPQNVDAEYRVRVLRAGGAVVHDRTFKPASEWIRHPLVAAGQQAPDYQSLSLNTLENRMTTHTLTAPLYAPGERLTVEITPVSLADLTPLPANPTEYFDPNPYPAVKYADPNTSPGAENVDGAAKMNGSTVVVTDPRVNDGSTGQSVAYQTNVWVGLSAVPYQPMTLTPSGDGQTVTAQGLGWVTTEDTAGLANLGRRWVLEFKVDVPQEAKAGHGAVFLLATVGQDSALDNADGLTAFYEKANAYGVVHEQASGVLTFGKRTGQGTSGNVWQPLLDLTPGKYYRAEYSVGQQASGLSTYVMELYDAVTGVKLVSGGTPGVLTPAGGAGAGQPLLYRFALGTPYSKTEAYGSQGLQYPLPLTVRRWAEWSEA